MCSAARARPSWKPCGAAKLCPNVPAAVRRRAEAVRVWRAKAAKELGLDPGVLFPQRLIDRLAAEPPRDREALERVDGVRHWRAALFGPDLLKALTAA